MPDTRRIGPWDSIQRIIDAVGGGGVPGVGDVVGPAGATGDALVRYDGATGKLIQGSAVILDDTGWMKFPDAKGLRDASSNDAITINDSAGVDIGNAGNKVLSTGTYGITIQRPGIATEYADILIDGAVRMTSRIHGARMFFKAVDALGVTRELFSGDPDDSVWLNYKGTLEAETISGGFKATNSFTIAETINVTGILDEDNMSSNSATALATQQSIKKYVDDQVGGVPTGDVVGPESSTDNAVSRFDSTTGLLIQDSGVILGDDNFMGFPDDTGIGSASGVRFILNQTDEEYELIVGTKTQLTNKDDFLFFGYDWDASDNYIGWETSGGSAGNFYINAGGETILRAQVGSQAETDLIAADGTPVGIKIVGTTATIGTPNEIKIYVDGGGTNLTINSTGIKLNAGVSVGAIYDNDLMTEDSATALATQQSIKKYVDDSIGGIPSPSVDKIFEGDSSVEVVDAGTGTITTTIDGTPYIVSNAAGTTFSHTVTIPGSTLIVGASASIKSASDSIELWHNGSSKEGETVSGAWKATNGLQIAASGITITSILDEDDMVSNSATAFSTQQSIKKYVDDSVAGGYVGLSISNPDYESGTSGRAIWGDGTYVYSGGTGTSGIEVYTIDSSGDITDEGSSGAISGGYFTGFNGDGTFIFSTVQDQIGFTENGLYSFSRSGSTLTEVDSDRQGASTNQYWGVVVDGDGRIFVATDEGLMEYSVDGGGNLTHVQTASDGIACYSVEVMDDKIYTSTASSVRSYSLVVGVLTLQDTVSVSGIVDPDTTQITAASPYILAAMDQGGLFVLDEDLNIIDYIKDGENSEYYGVGFNPTTRVVMWDGSQGALISIADLTTDGKLNVQDDNVLGNRSYQSEVFCTPDGVFVMKTSDPIYIRSYIVEQSSGIPLKTLNPLYSLLEIDFIKSSIAVFADNSGLSVRASNFVIGEYDIKFPDDGEILDADGNRSLMIRGGGQGVVFYYNDDDVARTIDDGLQIDTGILTLSETTTPSADFGKGKIYCKSDNSLYFQDGAGTEHEIAFV